MSDAAVDVFAEVFETDLIGWCEDQLAAYRKELAERVRGLGWIRDSDGWFCDECHTTSKANGHLSHCPYVAVLALIEEATP